MINTEDTAVMSTVLHEADEYLAAGYYEDPDASPLRRMARGLRRHFEHAPLPEWNGEVLYPTGHTSLPLNHAAVRFSYSFSLTLNTDRLADKIHASPNGAGEVLKAVESDLRNMYRIGWVAIPGEYSLGGGGYTHSIINFGRILREGLSGYAVRLERYAANNDDPNKADFYSAMQDVIEGLITLNYRIRNLIEAMVIADPDLKHPGLELLAALEQAPLNPARNFYEAIVGANLMWYVDGCDDLGRFDQDLGPYLEADLDRKPGKGVVSREDALSLVRMLWRNVDVNSGWNVALGGSDVNGNAAYNTLTELCLEAVAGLRRPNVALRVRQDMPDRIFDRAVEAIASGCGLPAMYNEEGYLNALPRIFPDIGADVAHYAFGGCTETMVHGRSNVGSIDGGLNLLGVLSETIRKHLPSVETFEAFMETALADIRDTLVRVIECVNKDQRLKAEFQPQPLRTLLIDDCLERGVEYNAGGARYNSGVINLGGLANVADSLAAIRDLVFGGRVSARDMIAALEADFDAAAGHDGVLRLIRSCPKFGNDDDRVDDIAVRVATEAFEEIRSHRTWRGDTTFEPACIMFVTYAFAGETVPATPDGRRSGEPVADSIGAMQGRDTHGPTAMLQSVAKLPLHDAIGTPIVNIRFARDLFNTHEGREKFKSIVRAYFAMGGMQLQVSVIDQAAICDAILHPDRHADLIVRIGGYSEYFNNLTPELKQSVLERTEHILSGQR